MIMFCQWKARMVCSCNGHAMFAVWSYCAHLMPDATYIPWIVPYHHTTKPPYHHTTIPPYRHTTLPPYRHDGMIWFVKWYGMVYRRSVLPFPCVLVLLRCTHYLVRWYLLSIIDTFVLLPRAINIKNVITSSSSYAMNAPQSSDTPHMPRGLPHTWHSAGHPWHQQK